MAKKKPNRSDRCMAVEYGGATAAVKLPAVHPTRRHPLIPGAFGTPAMTAVLLSCPIMADLVARHIPPRIETVQPFLSLVDAIVSQQISGKAADSIMARLQSLVAIRPGAIATADLRLLRRAGLSRAKARYVRALGRFALAGGLRGLARRSDAEIVERLTQVDGVGPWTAEMFLIFCLQRPDVWPVGDGGVQRAGLRLYGAKTPKALERIGDRFRPFRTSAAWYFWRSLEDG